MEFSNQVIEKAWKRAKGHCECTRTSHGHSGRCNKQLVRENRRREGRGKWESHHVVSTGPDTLSNCEILCFDCHKQTKSFGKN